MCVCVCVCVWGGWVGGKKTALHSGLELRSSVMVN